jgi:hypothetical protein
MNSDQIKSLVTFGLCMVFAAFLGYLLANSEYGILVWLIYLAIGMFLFFAPGYIPLIALGLVSPINLPIPLIRQFPFVALMLGLCLFKYMIRRWLTHMRDPSPTRLSLPIGFALFFGWVCMRYCLDPVIPNLRGFGENVSGFRPYLNYAVCLGLAVLISLFFRRVDDVKSVLRWMAVLATFLVVLLILLSMSKSLAAAEALARLGVYVSFFDNGWLRFVVLPGLGTVLLVFGLLPRISGWGRTRSRVMIGLGLAAIVMGGGRGSFLGAAAALAAIAVVRRQFLGLTAALAGLALCLGIFRYVGENYTFREGAGALRILSLVSPRVAALTGAADTVVWRQRRWERAMQDIYRRPWIGHGYGGLERAFVYGSRAGYEAAQIEIDVVTGAVHNGFIAGARALGVPALGLFLVILIGRTYSSGRLALRLRESDPERSELHCLAFAQLAAFVPAIYIGTDLNAPVLWFYLFLGVLVEKLKAREPAEEAVPAPDTALIAPRPAVA